MTKRHACPICKQRRAAPVFMVNLSWAIGGAVLGAVLTPVVERTGAEMREWLYEGRMNLEEGNRLRGKAVREASAAKHRISNLAFERSWQQAHPRRWRNSASPPVTAGAAWSGPGSGAAPCSSRPCAAMAALPQSISAIPMSAQRQNRRGAESPFGPEWAAGNSLKCSVAT